MLKMNLPPTMFPNKLDAASQWQIFWINAEELRKTNIIIINTQTKLNFVGIFGAQSRPKNTNNNV